MDISPFHRLDDRHWTLWAKSAEFGTDFMALPVHMADAAGVADLLWDVWVPESAQRVVWDSLGGGADEDVRGRAHRLACFLAAVHDVGKASPAFSSQVPALVPRIEATGLGFRVFAPRERALCPHSWVSAMALEEWATTRGVAGRRIQSLGAVLAGHHGVYPNRADLKFARTGSRGAGNEDWSTIRQELIAAAAETVGFSQADLVAASQGLSQPAQLILSGFVIVCDWIASNVDLFPLHRTPGIDDDTADAALTALDLTLPWIAEPPPHEQLFGSRFDFPQGARPRPAQIAAAEIASQLSQPELIIIEAPTGEGKTEAAKAAAEILAAKFGLGGVFFGLPTQATSDAMFSRVLAWLDSMLEDQDASLSLSHGKAQFNRDFDELRRISALRGIWDEVKEQSGVRAHTWLTRKKAVLANFVVGTIDQLLLMALQTRHVSLRHLGFAGKVVVLDEIHAADTYMSVYLVRALEWLASYGVPVIALSATLPPARRRALIEAYAKGRGERDLAEISARVATAQGFPLIVTSSPAMPDRSAEPSQMPTPTTVEFMDPQVSLTELMSELLSDGGCAAVVCNTVSRAQAAYAELREVLGDDVVLLHSRFITVDRLTIEADLRVQIGPPAQNPRRPRTRVVVATQVIEQSLDLDFDVMVSDLAPMDLVFQRMGRLHRHVRPLASRPEKLSKPRLLLRGCEFQEEGPPELDRGSIRVYGAAPLLRSAAILRAHLASTPTLSSVTDVVDLVGRAYAPDCPAPMGWETAWEDAERDAAAQAVDREQRAQQYCVSAPRSGALFGWMQAMTSEDSEAGHPAVRDIEDGIEAVVVVRGEDGRLRSLPWLPQHGNDPLDLGTYIEPGLARAVAQCTVRLPAHVARGAVGDGIVRELEADGLETWQKSPWLRGMLPLALDESLTRTLQGWVLRYDRRVGLLVEKEGATTHG